MSRASCGTARNARSVRKGSTRARGIYLVPAPRVIRRSQLHRLAALQRLNACARLAKRWYPVPAPTALRTSSSRSIRPLRAQPAVTICRRKQLARRRARSASVLQVCARPPVRHLMSSLVMPVGSFLLSGSCVSCNQGEYKSTWDLATSCTACTNGLTTSSAGSTSSSACICGPGYTWDGSACQGQTCASACVLKYSR